MICLIQDSTDGRALKVAGEYLHYKSTDNALASLLVSCLWQSRPLAGYLR